MLIVISGGQTTQYQISMYDMTSDDITDLGLMNLSIAPNNDGEHGFSTYFTQLESMLYTINQNGESINVWDLSDSFGLWYHGTLGTTIPINVNLYGCIASANTPSPTLYITGGNNGSNTEPAAFDDLQVLNLDDMQWLSSPPSMTETRHRHGCIVENDKLWAIGGRHESTVEGINTNNIASETWNVIGSLNCNVTLAGITAFDSIIFVVGGYCKQIATRLDTVYTIDTVANTVNVSAFTLPFGVHGMPVVEVDGTIYGFGGRYKFENGSGAADRDGWLTLDMLCILSQSFAFSHFWSLLNAF